MLSASTFTLGKTCTEATPVPAEQGMKAMDSLAQVTCQPGLHYRVYIHQCQSLRASSFMQIMLPTSAVDLREQGSHIFGQCLTMLTYEQCSVCPRLV